MKPVTVTLTAEEATVLLSAALRESQFRAANELAAAIAGAAFDASMPEVPAVPVKVPPPRGRPKGSKTKPKAPGTAAPPPPPPDPRQTVIPGAELPVAVAK